LTYTFGATEAKAVKTIAIKTQPANLTAYTVGDALNLTALVVTLTYNDGEKVDVPFANFGDHSLTAEPPNNTQLRRSEYLTPAPVVIKYGDGSTVLPVSTDANLVVSKKNFTGSGSEIYIDTIAAQTYTASPFTPSVTVHHSASFSTSNMSSSNYDVSYGANKNVGSGTSGGSVTITGKGEDYEGSKTFYFDITPKSLSDATVTVDAITEEPYDGTQHRPGVTVRYGTDVLNFATGASNLSYGANINAGIGVGSVTISPSNSNYSGSRTVNFTINQVDPTVVTLPSPIPASISEGARLDTSLLTTGGSVTGVGGVTVTGTWSWVNGTKDDLAVTTGSPPHAEPVIFTPSGTDAVNYNNITGRTVDIIIDP